MTEPKHPRYCPFPLLLSQDIRYHISRTLSYVSSLLLVCEMVLTDGCYLRVMQAVWV